jgi:hypothetical protein
MTTAYTWIQSNILVDKIDVNCKQKPPVNRTQAQRGTSQTLALKTSQASYRQMSGRNRIQPYNMPLYITLKGFHQGRGVHVTGVSPAYTFKLNKNILSE